MSDLLSRVRRTRWSEPETVADESQGVQLATLQKLAKYWVEEYDWRKIEARLNAFPQFLTEIDGLDIHFIHVKSKHEDALPIILTHGWPGSVIWHHKLIEPLVDPTAHGGRSSEAFHVVVPSIPGYGFSGKPKTTGWGPQRIARAWVELMKRLGYSKFVAQGGDWGAVIVDQMGADAAPELVGIHTNMPGAVPAEIDRAAAQGMPPPNGLSPEETHAFDELSFVYKHIGYAIMMATHPQSLAGLADSPIGLAAYMLDLERKSYLMIAGLFDDVPSGLSKDDIIDNISLVWLTNTAISAARLYWENKLPYFAFKGVAVPVAVSAFPDELFQVPRKWAEMAYPNLIYYNKPAKGGHFAPWEQPQIFADELRNGLASLR